MYTYIIFSSWTPCILERKRFFVDFSSLLYILEEIRDFFPSFFKSKVMNFSLAESLNDWCGRYATWFPGSNFCTFIMLHNMVSVNHELIEGSECELLARRFSIWFVSHQIVSCWRNLAEMFNWKEKFLIRFWHFGLNHAFGGPVGVFWIFVGNLVGNRELPIGSTYNLFQSPFLFSDDQFNQALNADWKAVTNEALPSLSKAFSKMFKSVVGRIMQPYPFNALFPPQMAAL